MKATKAKYDLIVYSVHAYRWGNRKDHSYPVGVYRTKNKALKAAEAEEQYRGGKYVCEVYKWTIDDGIAEKSEKGWKTIKGM